MLQTALDNDFDPTLSHRLTLDHGTCIPLWRVGVDPELPLVPILVNDLEAPMPSIRRCLAWGRLLRRAIESYPEPLRVAVLGTGGLSHSIGETTMGWIDETFDHACIDAFARGEERQLDAFLTEALDAHRQRRARNPRLGHRPRRRRQHRLRADRLFSKSGDAGRRRLCVMESAGGVRPCRPLTGGDNDHTRYRRARRRVDFDHPTPRSAITASITWP